MPEALLGNIIEFLLTMVCHRQTYFEYVLPRFISRLLSRMDLSKDLFKIHIKKDIKRLIIEFEPFEITNFKRIF